MALALTASTTSCLSCFSPMSLGTLCTASRVGDTKKLGLRSLVAFSWASLQQQKELELSVMKQVAGLGRHHLALHNFCRTGAPSKALVGRQEAVEGLPIRKLHS